jgi:hypothetical protein
MNPTAIGPWTVTLPDMTPNGQTVAILRDKRSDATLMHAESPDQSELYFEVSCYHDQRDHAAAIAAQQAFLAQHAKEQRIGATAATTVTGRDATTFDFEGWLQGRWKVRRFLFVDAGGCTHRIVFDPTSRLNHDVLATLALDARGLHKRFERPERARERLP